MPEEDEKEMQSLGLPDMEKEINKSMLGANRMPSISPFA